MGTNVSSGGCAASICAEERLLSSPDDMGSSGGPNKRGDKKGEFRRLRIDDLLNHDTPAGPSRPPRTSGAGPSSAGGRNRIKCPYCPKLFGSREELKRHRQVEHPTAFVCEQCNTSFFDRGNLNKHVRPPALLFFPSRF